MCIRDSIRSREKTLEFSSTVLPAPSPYLKVCIDNRKKNLLSSNISPTCPYNMVNIGPLAAEIVLFGAPQLIATGFASWQCYCTALWWWALAKVCGVEQRAPPIFGRAAITLGIGPHSSLFKFECWVSCHLTIAKYTAVTSKFERVSYVTIPPLA